MTDQVPRALYEGGLLIVTLTANHGVRRVDFDGIIDQTAFGDVVGVEILDLRAQLGGAAAPPAPTQGLPRWSYDAEIDAFYVRLGDSTAPIQKPIVGTAVIDQTDRLSSLEFSTIP